MSTPTAYPPPQIPEGWNPKWSPDHNAWYYVNVHTGVSIWEVPVHPAYPMDPNAPQNSQYQQPHPQQQPYGAQQAPTFPGPQQQPYGVQPSPSPGLQQQPYGTPQGPTSPEPPASGAHIPPTDANTPTPVASHPDVTTGINTPAESADGERGLFGKQNGQKKVGLGTVALGVGAGALLGGVAEHEWKKHGHFQVSGPNIPTPSFQMSGPNIPTPNFEFSGPSLPNFGFDNPLGKIGGFFKIGRDKQHHNHHHGHHAAGAGLAGGLVGAAISHHHHQQQQQQQQPQQQYQQPQQQYQYQQQPQQHHQYGGGAGLFGGGGGSGYSGSMDNSQGRLSIISANYGGGDVTEKVRGLVTPSGHLDLTDDGDGGVYDRKFGDHWGGTWKSLLILYQYNNGPMELLITWQGSGIKGLTPADPPRRNRQQFITHMGPVIAIVWGIMEDRTAPVPEKCAVDIASGNTFKATDTWFGFDGWKGNGKTAVVFYRNGHGQITNMALKQDGMGKLDI